MSRVHFYTTRNDILCVCAEVDRKLHLKALRAFQTPVTSREILQAQEHPSVSSIPHLGVATVGDSGPCPAYVLIDSSIDLKPSIRETGEAGNYFCYMSSTLHEAAASIRAGGEYNDDGIIMGEVMLQVSSKESERIVRSFKSALKKYCPAKARGAWIGAEALDKLKEGWRLTYFYNHPKPEVMDINLSEVEAK